MVHENLWGSVLSPVHLFYSISLLLAPGPVPANYTLELQIYVDTPRSHNGPCTRRGRWAIRDLTSIFSGPKNMIAHTEHSAYVIHCPRAQSILERNRHQCPRRKSYAIAVLQHHPSYIRTQYTKNCHSV